MSQEPCRKSNKIHHFSPLPIFLRILVCSFILDGVSKKMLCAKPQGAQAPPLFAYRGGINPKPCKRQPSSALFNKSLAPSIPVGAKNPYAGWVWSLVTAGAVQHRHYCRWEQEGRCSEFLGEAALSYLLTTAKTGCGQESDFSHVIFTILSLWSLPLLLPAGSAVE